MLLLLVVIWSLTISGCSMGIASKNLMRPPNPTGEELLVLKAIEKKVGNDIVLKYPRGGDYRAAITIKNISNDEKKVAVAFYSTEMDSNINVMILSQDCTQWVCEESFRGQGIGIDKLCFSDIDNDGKEEIVIGWHSYNNLDNHISVYCSNKDKYEEIKIVEPYTEFILSDLDSDNINEIMLLSLSDNSNSAKVQLLKVNTKDLKTEISGVSSLSDKIIKFNSVKFGKITEDIYGVMVDSVRSDNGLSVEVIYWDNSKNLLSVFSESSYIINYDHDNKDEEFKVMSMDINNDGIIEMPLFYYADKPGVLDRESALRVDWMKLKQKEDLGVEFVCETTFLKDDFIFINPDNWSSENVYISEEKSTGDLIFSEIQKESDDVSKYIGADILKIQVLTESEFTKLKNSKEEIILLDSYKDRFYVASIPQKDNQLVLSEDEIRKRFILIKND